MNHKNKSFQFVGIALSLMIFIFSCKEEKVAPLPSAGGLPSNISNINIVNLHGGATITYTVPPDPNLLYVEAIWENNGEVRTAKSSAYTDTLKLDGFGDSSEHEVKIYSVGLGEQKSAATTVKVKPLSSPVFNVYKSLTIVPDFGGVNTSYTNSTQGNVVITILTKDSANNIVPVNTFYTNLVSGSFPTRGFDSIPRIFGIYVKDRWGNKSDTLFINIKPIYEILLNKSLFKEVNPYPSDINGSLYSTAYPMKNLWDNNLTNFYHTAYTTGMPESFTFDLGVTTRLSRLKYYQRPGTFFFASACPRIFEIWGSNNPGADGGWDSWTLLTTCTSVKPSGLPIGQLTNADIAYATAGEDFTFPLTTPAVRFLRVKIVETWGKTAYMHFDELTFWGGN